MSCPNLMPASSSGAMRSDLVTVLNFCVGIFIYNINMAPQRDWVLVYISKNVENLMMFQIYNILHAGRTPSSFPQIPRFKEVGRHLVSNGKIPRPGPPCPGRTPADTSDRVQMRQHAVRLQNARIRLPGRFCDIACVPPVWLSTLYNRHVVATNFFPPLTDEVTVQSWNPFDLQYLYVTCHE